MALADRDYQRAPSNMRGGGFLSSLPPVVKALLFINVGIFLLDYLVLQSVLGVWLHPQTLLPRIAQTFGFTIDGAIYHGKIWQFLTFQFMHGGFLHIIFNSFGLFIFGPWMERWWGSQKFLLFYLLTGAAGAAFYTILFSIGILEGSPKAPLVGASAGIFGILIGVAVIAPNLRVQLLFPPIELSMRQLAIGFLVFAAVKILFNLSNAGGEAGHLGGAILGFILMKFPQLIGSNNRVIIEPPRPSAYRPESKLKPRSELNLNDDPEVDAILDKISAEGFQSLTDEEKAILQKAAEKNNS